MTQREITSCATWGTELQTLPMRVLDNLLDNLHRRHRTRQHEPAIGTPLATFSRRDAAGRRGPKPLITITGEPPRLGESAAVRARPRVRVDQGVHAVDRLSAGFDGAAAGDPQLPHALHHAGRRLRDCLRVTGQHGPGGVLGVDGVGLAAPPAPLPVRAVHFDDLDAGSGQVSGQARTPAAGAFTPTAASGPRLDNHSDNMR